MSPRLLVLCLFAAVTVFAAVLEAPDAREKPSQVRAKKKKIWKKEGKVKKRGSSVPSKGVPQGETEPPDAQETPEVPFEEPASEIMEQPDSAGDDQEGALSQDVTGEGSLRRSGRMEFDERLIKGQAAKSGAVYLFKRVPRRLPGLVPMRRSYRRRIVAPVLGDRILKPARYSKKARLKEKEDEASEASGLSVDGDESMDGSEEMKNAKE